MSDKTADMADFEDILRDPSAVFDEPPDVIGHGGFDTDQKIRVLEQWRYDLVRLQAASDESLVGDGTAASRIRTIDECLRQLRAEDASG